MPSQSQGHFTRGDYDGRRIIALDVVVQGMMIAFLFCFCFEG